jgi:hypothetical protein
MECQNGGQRSINVFLKILKHLAELTSFIQFDLHIRRRNAQKHGFPEGAQEGCDQRNGKKEEKSGQHGRYRDFIIIQAIITTPPPKAKGYLSGLFAR